MISWFNPFSLLSCQSQSLIGVDFGKSCFLMLVVSVIALRWMDQLIRETYESKVGGSGLSFMWFHSL